MNSRQKSNEPTYSSSQFNLFFASPEDRFIWPTIRIKPPSPIVMIPMKSSTCGGLKILISRPKESCHQLSKGAEVSMANPPHAAMNAPRGPRNPQIRTDDSLAAESALKVVCRIRYAQERPVNTAPN